ncbi:cytochrome c [Roseivirga sp.]|uniref:c-type cytochrome n=1 Tax=Roseivirga sp. TaxID=1964215 RepID=UPI002B274E00|nr:cytochrome c [Roseivirga sp.]
MKKQLFLFSLIVGLATSCSDSKKAADNETPSSTLSGFDQKETQYYSNGRRLYKTICQNCHMENGEGLGRLIPPLAKSDFLKNNRADLPRIVKFGLHGPISVNGVEFNQPMPANPKLTDIEVAEILTYVGNTWGNEVGSFTTEEVISSLSEKE